MEENGIHARAAQLRAVNIIMANHYNIAVDCLVDKANDPKIADRVALAFVVSQGAASRGVKLTYKNLNILTNRCAQVFYRLLLKPKDRVVICLTNTPEFAIAFFGAIKAGLLPVPISAALTPGEIAVLVADCKAKALVIDAKLVTKDLQNMLPRTLREILAVSPANEKPPLGTQRFQNLLLDVPSHFEIKPTDENDPAYMLYTSGTTKKARAVVHAHRSIPAHDARVRDWLDLQRGDVVFNTGALNWSYGLTAAMMDVIRHAGTALFANVLPQTQELVTLLRDFEVTTFMSVPGVYRRLVREVETLSESLPKLRVCLSAGEKMAEDVKRKFDSIFGITIREGLGMTEHSVYIYQCKDFSDGSVGRIQNSKNVKLLGEDLQPLKAGETGVIATHATEPGLMLGYGDFESGDLKIEMPLTENWFLSGDRAYQDLSGNVYFAGRNDDVITAGGYKISPLEVESVVNSIPEIKECAAVEKKLPEEKNIVALFVVARGGQKLTSDKLKQKIAAHCEQKLARFKRPREIVIVEALPKTSNSKIKRATLRSEL